MPTFIILGGGFAGVKCARTLSKRLGSTPHEIVVFNRENHMVFHPLLAEVASADVQPEDVGAPLRQLLTDAECRTENVLNIDLENRCIEYESHNGELAKMAYDHLVIACGSEANMAIIPGMADHAFGLKTIGDALALQTHIMEQLEKAEVCSNIESKRRYLSFVIVGGGFSGVEVAGEINELVRRSRHFFKHIKEEDITVTIVHSRDRLLPEVSPSLGDFALQKMRKAGLQVLLNAQVIRATSSGAVLKDGTQLPAETVVCTIGTTTSLLIQRLDMPKERGRLVVDADMSLPGCSNVWAIGDCAAITNAVDNCPCPPVAQFAERQGTQVAHNIVNRINQLPTKPFSFKMLGSLCAIGGRDAVAEVMGLKISGLLAWIMWRGIYLMKLPSIAQQIRVAIGWSCDLVFPRSLAHLKTDRSKQIKRAFFAAGDWVFREGDPATEFFMIEQGEVEVVSERDGENVLAILSAGDFFGEAALLDVRTRNASVRARSDIELVVLGSSVFNKISGALRPLKESLASAMKRRRNIWTNLDNAREILEQIPLQDVIDPLPGPPLLPDASILEAIERINQHRLDFCAVVNQQDVLVGIVTRADLLQAIELAATVCEENAINIAVSDIMLKDPLVISLTDKTFVALTTMRERGMTSLLVVESCAHRAVQGYARIENIMDAMVQRRGIISLKEARETALAKT